ncbi:MAG: family acetyltransferase [Lacrimispora sp.]|jgi:GNAT superfamily N-acetyltransferase|nr:family acetyltransferase [Lacrimispora sp.]
MEFEMKENVLTVKDYQRLRTSVGWSVLPEQQIEMALKNSLITITVRDQEQVVGMCRLVGDGCYICYVQDLVILPEYQGRGIGKSMIERVVSYVNQQGFPGTNITLGLFSAMGKEEFYQKQGFHIRPSDNRGAGMEIILPVYQDTGV